MTATPSMTRSSMTTTTTTTRLRRPMQGAAPTRPAPTRTPSAHVAAIGRPLGDIPPHPTTQGVIDDRTSPDT
jgi:hypothetical protein